jgi:hypothetical protein
MQLSFRLLILLSGSQLVTAAPVAAPAATSSPQSAPVATLAPLIVVPVTTETLPTYPPGLRSIFYNGSLWSRNLPNGGFSWECVGMRHMRNL